MTTRDGAETQRHDNRYRGREGLFFSLVMTALVLQIACTAALASKIPVEDPTTKKLIAGTVRFTKGETITVYIPTDPSGTGKRHLQLAEGIRQWKAEMQLRGVKIKIQHNPPPGNTQNLVTVKWVKQEDLPAGKSGTGEPLFTTTESAVQKAVGGTIKIAEDSETGTFTRNLGIHEFGHVLGFGDEETAKDVKGEDIKDHNAMDKDIPNITVVKLTDVDRKEIDQVYGTRTGIQARGNVVTTNVEQLVNGGYRYSYEASWLAGPGISFVQIGTNGWPVTNIKAGVYALAGTKAPAPTPDGWFLFDPRDSSTFEEYLEDIDFTVQPASEPLEWLTFVNQRNPLGPTGSRVSFSFESDFKPGPVKGYISGDQFTTLIGPSAVPELESVAGLGILLGLGALGLARGKRLRGGPMCPPRPVTK